MSNIVLVDGARTAFTEISGTFRGISATDLGVEAARGAIQKLKSIRKR